MTVEPNLVLKTRDLEVAERTMAQMEKNTDLRWYVAKSGDPEFPWGLFNELVRYGNGAMAADKAPCGFCKGQPVGDAATWVDGKPRLAAPCPRCGVVTPYPETEAA